MEKQRDINSYFEGILENINIILDNSFYSNDDKKNLEYVKLEVETWYISYKEKNTLKCIQPNKLKNIGIEITDFFDKYVMTEPVKENYAERLSYDFGYLEKNWKVEMLGGKKNG